MLVDISILKLSLLIISRALHQHLRFLKEVRKRSLEMKKVGLITYHAMADDHIPINMYFRERKQSICSSATSKRKWSCFQQRLTAALGLVPQRPTLLMAYPMINCREITLICNVVLPHGMNPPDAFSLERSLPAIPAVKKEIHDIGRNVTCLECPANTWLYPFADARLYLGEGSCRSSLQARQPV